MGTANPNCPKGKHFQQNVMNLSPVYSEKPLLCWKDSRVNQRSARNIIRSDFCIQQATSCPLMSIKLEWLVTFIAVMLLLREKVLSFDNSQSLDGENLANPSVSADSWNSHIGFSVNTASWMKNYTHTHRKSCRVFFSFFVDVSPFWVLAFK